MAANFKPRRAVGRERRRPDWRVRVLVGFSPVWLLAGVVLAGKLPASDGPVFLGSTAEAQDLETPSAAAESERLAGIEPSGTAETGVPERTEVASLDAPISDEPGLSPEPLANWPAASVTEATGERGLRAISGAEDRARTI